MYNRAQLKEKATKVIDKKGIIGPDINLDEFDEAPISHAYLADEDLCELPNEEQQRLIAEADMYMIEKHWLIWGPKTPQFMLAQPWLIGYNGEPEGAVTTIYARLWIDPKIKKAVLGR